MSSTTTEKTGTNTPAPVSGVARRDSGTLLASGDGQTKIADVVVQKIASLSAREVPGVRSLGGGTAHPLLLYLLHGLCHLRQLRPSKTVHPLHLPSPYQSRVRRRCKGLRAVAVNWCQVQRLEAGGVLWAQGGGIGRVVFPPRSPVSLARVLRRHQLFI